MCPEGEGVFDSHCKMASLFTSISSFFASPVNGFLDYTTSFTLGIIGFGNLGPLASKFYFRAAYILYPRSVSFPSLTNQRLDFIAAYVQSWFGGYVPAGGIFAFFQSAGMGGWSFRLVKAAFASAFAGAGAGAGAALWNPFRYMGKWFDSAQSERVITFLGNCIGHALGG